MYTRFRSHWVVHTTALVRTKKSSELWSNAGKSTNDCVRTLTVCTFGLSVFHGEKNNGPGPCWRTFPESIGTVQRLTNLRRMGANLNPNRVLGIFLVTRWTCFGFDTLAPWVGLTACVCAIKCATRWHGAMHISFCAWWIGQVKGREGPGWCVNCVTNVTGWDINNENPRMNRR